MAQGLVKAEETQSANSPFLPGTLTRSSPCLVACAYSTNIASVLPCQQQPQPSTKLKMILVCCRRMLATCLFGFLSSDLLLTTCTAKYLLPGMMSLTQSCCCTSQHAAPACVQSKLLQYFNAAVSMSLEAFACDAASPVALVCQACRHVQATSEWDNAATMQLSRLWFESGQTK